MRPRFGLRARRRPERITWVFFSFTTKPSLVRIDRTLRSTRPTGPEASPEKVRSSA